MTKPNWQDFEEFVTRYVAAYGVPGIAVGVAHRGEIVYFHGFGSRDREKLLPVTADTVFGIGSITKSFTAMSIMQLVEQGKLATTDPVRTYLPELRIGKGDIAEKITVHHLLNHTTGTPPLPSLMHCLLTSIRADPAMVGTPAAARFADAKSLETYADLAEYLSGLDIVPIGNPGALFSYWNDGWALLGEIIARVSGQPYEEYVTEHILQPAGMTRSTFDVESLLAMDDVATLYAGKPGSDAPEDVAASPAWLDSKAMCAAGFLKSSVTDMLRYLDIYRSGGMADGGLDRIVSQESLVRMTTPYIGLGGGSSGYGYGLRMTPNYHGVTLVEHSGGIKGVSANVIWVPQLELTSVLLSNLGGVPSGSIHLGAVNAFLGLPAQTRRIEWQEYIPQPERLPLYAGKYASGEGALARVQTDGGQLLIEMEGKTYRARPVALDTFTITQKLEEMAVRFMMAPDGRYFAAEVGARVVPRVE